MPAWWVMPALSREAEVRAARLTTLINIRRALWLEQMLIPQAMVPAVDALLRRMSIRRSSGLRSSCKWMRMDMTFNLI